MSGEEEEEEKGKNRASPMDSLSLSLWREGIGLGGFGRTCYFSSPVFLRGKISPERIPEEAIGLFYFLSFFLRELDGGRRELISSEKKWGTLLLRTIKAGTSFSTISHNFCLQPEFF